MELYDKKFNYAELAKSFISRFDSIEKHVNAWEVYDNDYFIRKAKQLDESGSTVPVMAEGSSTTVPSSATQPLASVTVTS